VPWTAVRCVPAVKLRLVTLAAAASLLLCIATVALWVRSYSDFDFAARYNGRGGYVGVTSCSGSIHIFSGTHDTRRLEGYYLSRPREAPAAGAGGVTRFTLSYVDGLWMTCPHWFPCAVTGLLAALFARLLRRHQMGSCFSCGYDLRATPERCPECGAVPAAR
jgi:hypothetical protein